MAEVWKLLTRSGAIYLVDDDLSEMCRLSGPYSPGIDYTTHQDETWNHYTSRSDIKLGESMVFRDPLTAFFRVTTPVVNVEMLTEVQATKQYAETVIEGLDEELKSIVEEG